MCIHIGLCVYVYGYVCIYTCRCADKLQEIYKMEYCIVIKMSKLAFHVSIKLVLQSTLLDDKRNRERLNLLKVARRAERIVQWCHVCLLCPRP